MCGIAGELSFTQAASGADWSHISALMARRGPDDEGHWSDGLWCTLAFRRLSIIDLSSNGHQPMLAGNGRYALVFNGELYNYRDIRGDLELRGVRFRSASDSEVVLRALMQWGSDALPRFNGMYALAFYDSLEKRLLVTRDHAGIKPIYVLHTEKGVVFASQYDQILAHPWSARLRPSPDAIGLYLRLAYIPAPYALLSGTHMLEPGAWMEYDATGRTRQGRHFEFAPNGRPLLQGSDAVDAVDAAVTSAVRRQLVSDVPVAAFLSGGIDSPLVVAKMLAVTKDNLRAFTIGTAGDATDESQEAAAYAAELGIAHTIEHFSSEQALALLDDVVNASSEPFGDYSIFPTMLVSRLAAREYKVVLSGDGGDELFWGYVRRMAPLIQTAPALRQPYPLRVARWAAPRLLGRPYGAEHLRWRTLGDGQRAKHTHLRGPWLPRVFPALPTWPTGYAAFDYAGSEATQTAEWLRWNEFVGHLTMVLLKVDRASMHHSLEVRVPLLDREVIDTALRVDWSACLDTQHMVGKLPLRRALSRSLRHQSSGKRGFEVPMGQWLRTSLRGVFEEAVLARDQLMGMPINRRALRQLFDIHLKGGRDFGWGLWPILSLALWEQRHFSLRSTP